MQASSASQSTVRDFTSVAMTMFSSRWNKLQKQAYSKESGIRIFSATLEKLLYDSIKN